jgi:hypothetical protein
LVVCVRRSSLLTGLEHFKAVHTGSIRSREHGWDLEWRYSLPRALWCGWGVDALLGMQTRPHTVLISWSSWTGSMMWRPFSGRMMSQSTRIYRPTRAVLRTADGQQIDLRPVTFDADGTGRQAGAAPDGTDCTYRIDEFERGNVAGRQAPCLAAYLQIERHSGSEPREHDRRYMALSWQCSVSISSRSTDRTGWDAAIAMR